MKLNFSIPTLLANLVLLLLLTTSFFPEKSFGQEPLTRKISFLDGLPTDVVYDLFVDRNGLLYLGTDKGLVTYNGVHFEQMEIEESLGNSISGVQQDFSGKIWCKNFANQLFYVNDGKLIPDKNVKNLLDQTKGNLVDFSIGLNAMYILTQDAVYTYRYGKFNQIYKIKDGEHFISMIYDRESQKLYAASGGTNYIFQNDRLIKKQNTTIGQKTLEIFKHKLSYSYRLLSSKCVIGSDIIEVTLPDLKSTFFNRLSATKDNLWLCTNNGIYEYNESKKEFKAGFLEDVRVTDIVQDLEGNHWISSLDEGLFLLPNRKIFELKVELPEKKKKMSYTRIAQAKNGHYYVGTNDGRILETTPWGKMIQIYDTKWDNNIEFINFIGDTILTNYGFFKQENTKLISNINYYGKGLELDRKGNLLIASPTFGGLISRDLKKIPNFDNPKNRYKIIDYGVTKIKTLVLRDKRARSVFYNNVEQKYFFGFIDGLYVYDEAGNESELKTENGEAIIAVAMLQNGDGSMWIASSQKGLFLIKNQKIIKHISVKNGLSDNNCRRIEKDNSGIWIVTETGFDYYDIKTSRVKNAQLNLCIKGITINDLTLYGSIVALATDQGIFYFDKKVLDETSLPNFNFTDFLVNGKRRNIENTVKLEYSENNINIKFNTIHYKSLGSYTYRSRLLGLDDKWFNQSSAMKNINFLSLNPGVYKFQINIKIGEKYTPIQEINFEISKPFWLQNWFLTIIILLILALMYFVYRWAVVKTRKSEELKEQLALSQLTALRSQMNPHFIFNILNAVQGLIYSNQKSKASDYLGKFSDLMRRILDTSDSNEVTIEKEFETIDLYVSLEKARFEEDFEYTISFPEDIDLRDYTIPSMIIQPFVENAIKHGLMHKSGLKTLTIKAELFDDVWCFTIDDNGIGRKASEIINQKIKKHISFATKAIDNRIKLISRTTDITIDIEVIDKKGSDEEALGTRIKIYIPLLDR
ncbi:histidine kinase [Flavobacterium antarcticum]|uniref:sensor histidine kinase n=1 Tax=Flavobacterium antarcticum TaxID=271155 RepID=UPI0003B2EA28|nr:histidine kinase [Flavobacterium antarcticum]